MPQECDFSCKSSAFGECGSHLPGQNRDENIGIFTWINEVRASALQKNVEISGQEFCLGDSCLAVFPPGNIPALSLRQDLETSVQIKPSFPRSTDSKFQPTGCGGLLGRKHNCGFCSRAGAFPSSRTPFRDAGPHLTTCSPRAAGFPCRTPSWSMGTHPTQLQGAGDAPAVPLCCTGKPQPELQLPLEESGASKEYFCTCNPQAEAEFMGPVLFLGALRQISKIPVSDIVVWNL